MVGFRSLCFIIAGRTDLLSEIIFSCWRLFFFINVSAFRIAMASTVFKVLECRISLLFFFHSPIGPRLPLPRVLFKNHQYKRLLGKMD